MVHVHIKDQSQMSVCVLWFLTHVKEIKVILGRYLAQLVERVSHVPRLCSGPGFDSQPGFLCCVSLPLSLPFSSHIFSSTSNKAIKRPRKYSKKKSDFVGCMVGKVFFSLY